MLGQFTASEHKAVMFSDCRRVIHPTTTDPEAKMAVWGGERPPSWRDARDRIQGPLQIGCGGRVFWDQVDPRYADKVGYVGVCTHCGWEVYSLDLLVEKPDVQRFTGRWGWRKKAA